MGSDSASKRRYEKGERRYKHVGSGAEPKIEFVGRDPKKWIGKCPSTISECERNSLLWEAIPVPNGDRDLAAPKKLYVVHEGAIYEAQTSDRGRSYHGYPYKGKIPGVVLRQLSIMATAKGCSDKFDAWVNRHIERHGASK